MIAVDTNLLVYSHRADADFHRPAKDLIEALRHQTTSWAIPWPCIHELTGIVTHPGIFRPASTLAEALAFVDSLFASPELHFLAESPGYFEKLRSISTVARLKGPRIHDARMAALCLHHGVTELWSADRDFSAFPQLRARNPLVKK